MEKEPLAVKLGLKPVIGSVQTPSLAAHGVVPDPRGPYETILDCKELYVLKPSKGQAVKCLYINRTNQLNTLKQSTVQLMHGLLKKWIENVTHWSITVKGAGDKAFCSGIDWREVYNAVEKGNKEFLDKHFRELYEMHFTMYYAKKPIISVINGLALGATGCAAAVNATFPLTTEKTVFALPETSMGFFPDCGMSYHLCKLDRLHPGFGYFLGLSGHHLLGPDLAHLKLATHHILVHMVQPLEGRLGMTITTDPLRVMSAIEECQEPFDTEKFSMQEHLAVIGRCFTKDSIEGILKALESEIYSTWATDLAKKMRGMCPLSLKVTFRALREVIGSEPSFNSEEFERRLKEEERENKRKIQEYKHQKAKASHKERQRELLAKLNGLLDNHKAGSEATVSAKERLQVVSMATERLEGLAGASDVVGRIISVESRGLVRQLTEALSKYPTFDDFLEQETERRNKEIDERVKLLPSERKAIEEREAKEDLDIGALLKLKGFPFDIDGKTPEEFNKSLINNTEKINGVFELLSTIKDYQDVPAVLQLAEATMAEFSKIPSPPDYKSVLERDFQIAMRFVQTEDFKQGIKARVITNTTPKWTHASVEEVTDAEVDELFRPLDETQQLRLSDDVDPTKLAIETAIAMERTTDSLIDEAIESGLDIPETEDFEKDMDQNFEAIVKHLEEESGGKKKRRRGDQKEKPIAPPLEQIDEEEEELPDEIQNPEDKPSYRAVP